MQRRMTLPSPPPDLLDRASLFLDLDGTLVELAETPDSIEVCDSLRTLLRGLADRLDGRLAVISGRGLADLAERLSLPELTLAGSHGAERRTPGGLLEQEQASRAILDATLAANAFAERHQVLVEAKPMGVAIHFRSTPALEPAVDRFAAQLGLDHGLLVQKGSMVRELRAPGRSKGDVVRLFMSEPPFHAGRPVMVGDDLTDEDAFAAVNDLSGASILVGADRPTQAAYRLPDVESVRQWLGGAR